MRAMYSPLMRTNWPSGDKYFKWNYLRHYTSMLGRLNFNGTYWVQVSTPSFDYGNNEPYLFQLVKMKEEGLRQEVLFRTHDLDELLPMLKLLVGSLEDERRSHE